MADTEVANLVKDAVLTNEVNQRVSREAGAGDAGRSGNLSKESSQETSQRESVSENGKKKTKEEKPPAKVVIRRLPPSMTKEIFLKEISPVPEHDYFYFVPGDPFAGTQMGFSRAYINFIHQEDIFRFTETYDNYVFVDSKGQEYPAIVEFALFQRIPKQRTKKRDTFSGSIQSDSTYLAFKETLEAAAVAKPDVTSKQHFFETDVSSNATQEATTTPLLEFLKQKRVDKARIRDERREEKKRKEAERKLRLKGKKSEAEEEPKDIKIVQTSVKTYLGFVANKRNPDVYGSKEDVHKKPSAKNLLTRNSLLIQPSLPSKNGSITDEGIVNLTNQSRQTLKGGSRGNFRRRQFSNRAFISDKDSRNSPANDSEIKAKQQTAFLRHVLKLSSDLGESPCDKSVKMGQPSSGHSNKTSRALDGVVSQTVTTRSMPKRVKSPLLPTPVSPFSIGRSDFPELRPVGTDCSLGDRFRGTPP